MTTPARPRMTPAPDRGLPRGILLSAVALVLFTILTVAGVRIFAPDREPLRPVVLEQSRDLRFEDRADGSVAVIDAPSGTQFARLAPGTNGFVRATLRGLARERRQHNQGAGPAFRLAYWSNGQLTLHDLATGRMVELGAFGHINAIDFGRLLREPPAASTKITLKD